jgi:DNA-binding transcriptional MerR regulator/methylmalonyl-CoA mutase cobalamin-binding subunit
VSDEKRHPIQVVVRRTGLTADVLRAWERRYGAVHPRRSAGSRRLYSDSDIERLRLLRRATAAGRSIGRISGLPTDALAAMVREDELAEAAVPRVPAAAGDDATAGRYLERSIEAVEQLDVSALDATLSLAAASLGAPDFLQHVLRPMLEYIGRGWESGSLGIAHEHAASAVTRQLLGTIIGSWRARPGAPTLLVATPSGERHEFGAMMAAAMAVAEGWRVVYLGADLPAEPIAEAAARHAPQAVALSIVHPEDGTDIAGQLETLRGRLPNDVTLIVGGTGAHGVESAIARAVRIADLAGFRSFLASHRTAGGH